MNSSITTLFHCMLFIITILVSLGIMVSSFSTEVKIVKSFPIHETASFSYIAKKVGLSELNVKRFLRHAMTNRIFNEVEPGVVAHTAASRLLAENSMMNDWVGFCVEEVWQVNISFLVTCILLGRSLVDSC